ncbi:MAG: HAD hydrolase family protein [Candidatus Zixiibacteriota bacterium]
MLKLQRKLEINVADLEMLIFDVDGVMTDNRMIFLKDNQEAKAFSAADGFAIKTAGGRYLKFGVITARGSEVTVQRCTELGVADVVVAWDKISALHEMAQKHNLDLSQIGYVGNDIPDLVAMEQVGLAVCVADAEPELLPFCHYQTDRDGGNGACREVINFVLAAKGLDLVKIYRDDISDAKTR